jgi:hypothetical protein
MQAVWGAEDEENMGNGSIALMEEVSTLRGMVGFKG